MNSAVEVSGVWKSFRRGERQDSLRDLIPALVRGVSKRPAGTIGLLDDTRDFWALRDVSFSVSPGEAVGVIGPNGAGKSTLLKVLNGILRPSRGQVAVRGRRGALIEIAAGFHPDLTGRENIFLQGAIMGMAQSEIGRNLESIIEFAGVERFIDTPVKRYSSGMNARLGFAIAAHLDPDVLIIDEVLSVGDAAFQARCIERMQRFKRDGVGIVFVSHDMQAISALCDRAVFLRGAVQAEGAVPDVIGAYLASFQEKLEAKQDEQVRVERVRLLEANGKSVQAVEAGASFALEVDCESRCEAHDIFVGLLMFRSTDGLKIYDGNFAADELGLQLSPGKRFTLRFELGAYVTRGQYHFDVHIMRSSNQARLLWHHHAAILRVDEVRSFSGIANPMARATLVESSGTSPLTVATPAGTYFPD